MMTESKRTNISLSLSLSLSLYIYIYIYIYSHYIYFCWGYGGPFPKMFSDRLVLPDLVSPRYSLRHCLITTHTKS